MEGGKKTTVEPGFIATLQCCPDSGGLKPLAPRPQDQEHTETEAAG